MAKVEITRDLFEDIEKKFKANATEIFDLIESVEKNPHKGKELSTIGGIVIKELRYQKFRFYFITDGYVLKFGSVNELAALLIKFVKMSEKKDQQKTINTVKNILKSMGFEGF